MNNSTKQKWEGRWDQLTGRVRKAWGVLTDDDLQQVKGDYERLIGKIKERTGESLEQIEKKIDAE